MIKLFSIPSLAKPDVEEIVLLCGKEYSVGRKQQDISLAKDTSISRHHATVQVDHPMANVTNASLTPSLVITDLGSKFGTFINDGIEANRPVSMREPNTLSHGDRFRFGLGSNIFKIQYTPMIATSSCLSVTAPLKKDICALGGHLVPEWTDKCDFLVMDNITLTVKVVCALLSAKHIVTPKFFEDYHEAVKTKKAKVPKPEDYLPNLAETSLPRDVNFSPDTSRTTLFQGKTFLFVSTRQSKKIGVAIKCGGGAVDLITNVTPIVLKSPDTIIVAPQDETIAGGPCANAVETYEKTNKRMVQESEIGLAAVLKTIQRNCNPFIGSTKKNSLNLASQTQQMSPGGDRFSQVHDSESASPRPMRRTVVTQSQSEVSRVDESAPIASKRTGSKAHEADGSDDVETSLTTDTKRRKADIASSSKRRLEDTRGGEPTTKVRQVPASPPTTQRSSRSAAKVLSSVFNMFNSSDDEDEIKDPDRVVVPDSQISFGFQRLTRSQALKSPEKLIIPDSQATPEKRRSPAKQSSPTKQRPECRGRSAEKDPLPGEPEIPVEASEAGPSNAEAAQKDAGRNKRKRTELPDNSDVMMPPPSIPAKKIKRAPSDVERTPMNAGRQGGWHETSISQVKKADPGAAAAASQEILKPLTVAFRSLLAKRNIMPQLEKAGNTTVKNFKVFKKVVPLTAVTTNSVISHSDRTTNTKKTTGSTLTFRRHIACPTEPLVIEDNRHRTSTQTQDDVPDFSFDE